MWKLDFYKQRDPQENTCKCLGGSTIKLCKKGQHVSWLLRRFDSKCFGVWMWCVEKMRQVIYNLLYYIIYKMFIPCIYYYI